MTTFKWFAGCQVTNKKLMSVKNATMHEKRTTAQNFENWLKFRTLARAVFSEKFRAKVNDHSSFPWLFGTGTSSQVAGVSNTKIFKI